MKLTKIYTLLFCLLAIAQTTFAQSAATLNIQGVLRNTNGTSVDNGVYKIKFSLYTVETGGTAVWTETQDSVVVSGGVYSTALGKVTALTPAFDQPYYLGMQVGAAAEISPRALLSSAPYALSLIGVSNQFPSSGAVAVGGVGTGNAEIQLKKGANTASITYDGTYISIPNLAPNGNPANLIATSKLAVGQTTVDPNHTLKVNGNSILTGTTSLNGYVFINGFSTYNPGSHYIHTTSSTIANSSGGGGQLNFSMEATARIKASEFWAFSDRRIKKDFSLSQNLPDLATLRQLRVTNYRHIDEVEKGADLKKGFVAQDVEQVFPEAVTMSAEFIPNVYAFSSKTSLSDGKMTIALDKAHDFAVGDELKLEIEKSNKQLTVVAVPSPNVFVVAWDDTPADKVFVYGKKVPDFHIVDYDRIFTLNVSATQELAQKVEILEKENAALRQQVGDLKADAKVSGEKTEARLRALENRLSN